MKQLEFLITIAAYSKGRLVSTTEVKTAVECFATGTSLFYI